ncbi:MAG TPA: diacylglycerol kinase family protein, partial [Blastocatellia bacterium]|nr:diacylglycerol kinase family protein [Blastocatellia bacterium]
ASARGTTLRAWVDVRNKLVRDGVEFAEHVTTGPGEATEITREALFCGITRIVAVGGDGTLGEVLNGYFDSGGCAISNAASIALLPSGTGSDFGRSLRFTSRSDALRRVIGSETRFLDAARAEFHERDGVSVSRTFINVASFGLGGDVSNLVNQWRERLPGWIGGRARFAAAALAALRRYKNIAVSLRLDGRDIWIDSNLIVLANGRFAGSGMMLAPHAALDDGLFDVILTDGATRWDVLRELPRIQRGRHLNNPRVRELRAREVWIDSEKPMAIDLDGEMVGYTPAHLTILPSSVRFAA